MQKNSGKTIYFHVGTGKTGTTFLQYRVFPKLKNLYYIQRTRYKNAVKIILKSSHSSFLVSREFDQQLETEVRAFADYFPNTIPIIVFRRQDSYIASQYRRFVKNGFDGGFTDFFNLETDEGRFRKADLEYVRQVNTLKKYFTGTPIVLIYEDMRDDPQKFIQSLAKKIEAEVDAKSIDISKKHSSYSEKQLKAMRWLSGKINMEKRRLFKNDVLNFFWRLGIGGLRYSFLFVAKFIPNSLLQENPLIPQEELSKVKKYYQKDWEACLSIARDVNAK